MYHIGRKKMDRIEVKVLGTPGVDPGDMMAFLGRLTQRGHKVSTMTDLMNLYEMPASDEIKVAMADLPHGTIKRFTPITVAIVGASRRFLMQARTHQVGINYVSASLQYSDYSGNADFVVPYPLLGNDNIDKRTFYLGSCRAAMDDYKVLIDEGVDNDTCGYMAPHALRNILIMQGNHQSWSYFIGLRGCNRNTIETQYVTLRIWEELLKTPDGEIMFGNIGPWEIAFILIIALLVIGPSKLPEVGKSLGNAIRSFNQAKNSTIEALSTENKIAADQTVVKDNIE
jgi:thymidylate synthase (FAD)